MLELAAVAYAAPPYRNSKYRLCSPAEAEQKGGEAKNFLEFLVAIEREEDLSEVAARIAGAAHGREVEDHGADDGETDEDDVKGVQTGEVEM